MTKKVGVKFKGEVEAILSVASYSFDVSDPGREFVGQGKYSR